MAKTYIDVATQGLRAEAALQGSLKSAGMDLASSVPMDFAIAFDRLIGHEKGFTDGHHDPGNWTGGVVGRGTLNGTNYGISAASYPHLNIKTLTREAAKEIYKRDFWDRIDGDELHSGVAFQVFDIAVNSGIETAVRMLQRALRVADDGHFGPESRKAAGRISESDQIMRLCAERLDFMRKLSIWPKFSKGWAGRIAENLRYGSEDN